MPPKAQAILVTMSGTQCAPLGVDLVAWMAARGFKHSGFSIPGRTTRPELRNQPEFDGLCGPMWGGEDHPLRYEDWQTYEEMSR